METIILFIVVALVLILALAWIYIIRKPVKETTSTRKFTVTLSQGWRKAALSVPSGFTVFAVFFLIMSFLGVEYDIEILIFLTVLAILFLPVVWFVVAKRLDVDLDKLRSRNNFGITKEIHANEIEKVVIETDDSFTIYANGKNFGNFGKELLHVDNFYQYCEEAGHYVSKEQSKTLKKWGLLVYVFRSALVMGLGFGAFMGIITLVLHFTGGLYADAPAGEVPLMVIGLTLGSMALIFVILFIPTMRNISRISVQERTLGFCFDDEMKKHNVTNPKDPFKPTYVSPEWFVAYGGGLAFRRDFIVQVKRNENFQRRLESIGRTQFIVSCADGKKRRITINNFLINEFETWLRSDLNTKDGHS